jgi:hypothetical protein
MPGPAALPKLVEKPPKRLQVPTRTARVRFALSVTEPTLNLVCKLDRRRSRCTTGPATFKARAGERWRGYMFAVLSLDPATAARPGSVRFRFRVRRR